MATIGATNPTIADVIKFTMPDGSPLRQIVDPLSQRRAFLNIVTAVECNQGTRHLFGSRTARPSLTWRMINRGIQPSKSRRSQISETTGILEGRNAIDEDLVRVQNNKAAFLADEESQFVEAFLEELSTGSFYHSVRSDPERFHGLSSRFGDVSDDQVIDGGSVGATNRSIWIIGFSPQTIFSIYPEGTPAGIIREYRGTEYVADRDGNDYLAHVSNWKWNYGLAVKDARYVVRIANVDPSDIEADLSSGPDLLDLLTQGIQRMESLEGVRTVIFMPRDILSGLSRQCLNRQAGNYLQWHKEILGFPGLNNTWQGVPMKIEDALDVDEARVV